MNHQLQRLDLDARRALQTLIDVATAQTARTDACQPSVSSSESRTMNPWAEAADGYDCLAS